MNIHPTAIIDDGAKLGDVEIGPYCRVGDGVRLHDGVVLKSHVVIEGPTEIGAGTLIYPFCVLGEPPQHLGCKGDGARLVVGAGNIIREHVTMHRGTIAGGALTSVGDGGFFMVGSHVAHDCHVGNKVIFANGAAIGGHGLVGDFAFLGAFCAIHQHCRIGDHAFIGGCAAVTTDVIPYASAVGNHARLVGLNVVGLKRRGFSHETIHNIRAAYRMLFFGEGVFRDRLDAVREKYGADAEVARVIEFIDAGKARSLMTAARED
ncbi:acyl-ACP--UDP-N-acetylglucosamine O-acyltransferase [Hyphococcus sp.]|jgi:UDP-N-acetylglucosamine acyltransferase|uniref:acyl-ACP--UDP-N-acetylglucosamine O-acyltransferase n=1 Tax=Hyphococcus sp. TaxID=2038636 RepID=UPI003D0E016D